VELVRLESFSKPGASTPAAVALGNFDGVHRGHQALVAEVVGASPAVSVVLTFDPHPARVLTPETAPTALMTLAQKAEVLEGLGVERVVVLPFTPALARTSAEEFSRQVLGEALLARKVVVGQSFRFGRGRSGDVAALAGFGARMGFEVRSVPPVFAEGAPVSSSRIRDLLAAGDVGKAALLLGRSFYVDGEVVRGAGRGRGLGIPTANVAVRNETLPAEGVYAGWVRVQTRGKPRAAVANLGRRPTFGQGQRMLEAHLLDFEGDLYGQEVRLEFVARLRDEARFAGAAALVEQVRKDAAAARAVLEKA
jgi:riboflavin kinase/FMN adenylyltransferase